MAYVHRDLIAPDATRLDPARNERHDDHGQYDGDLWNVAGRGDCDGEKCGGDRDDHGELHGGIPGAMAQFHLHVLSPAIRGSLV